jgi:hypothetical protein
MVYFWLFSVSQLHLFIVHTGDISYVTALGQHIVVINSEKIALDLCEKRSAIYSSRLQFPTVDL